MKRSERAGFALALISGCSFGTLGAFGKATLAEGQLDLPSMLALRFVGMAIMLFGWLALERPPASSSRYRLGSLLLGALLYGPGTLLVFAAMARIGVGAAVLLLYLFPILTTAFECIRDRAWPGTLRSIALVLGLAGAALCTELSDSRMDMLGVLYGFGTATLYACYLIGISYVGRGIDTRTSTAFVGLGAGATFLIVATLGAGLLVPWTQRGWALLLAFISFATILPILTGFAAIQRIGVARTAILSMTDPLVAVLLGHFLYGEPLGPARIAGGSLILLSVGIIQTAGRTRSSATALA